MRGIRARTPEGDHKGYQGQDTMRQQMWSNYVANRSRLKLEVKVY